MTLSPASQSNKICATCNNWSGVRQAPKNNTTIYVDSHTPSICIFYKTNIPKKPNQQINARNGRNGH